MVDNSVPWIRLGIPVVHADDCNHAYQDDAGLFRRVASFQSIEDGLRGRIAAVVWTKSSVVQDVHHILSVECARHAETDLQSYAQPVQVIGAAEQEAMDLLWSALNFVGSWTDLLSKLTVRFRSRSSPGPGMPLTCKHGLHM